jgi:hypothetical protein
MAPLAFAQDRRQAAALGGAAAYRGSDGGGGEPLAEGSSGGCHDGPCLAGVRVLPTVDLTCLRTPQGCTTAAPTPCAEPDPDGGEPRRAL